MTSVLPRHKYILCEGNKPLYIIVDGFNYASKLPNTFTEKNDVIYFLSHAHADHYQGLRPSFAGELFCSEITGNVIKHLLDVPEHIIRRLPMNTEIEVSFHVKVTLVCANHCPGAVMMLFDLPDGNKVIHCGDFRYDVERMSSCPHIGRFRGCSSIYLDTTYCNPRHKFPAQNESIRYISQTVDEDIKQQLTAEDGRVGEKRKSPVHDVLYLVSTYVIGKERILEEIHRRTGKPIYIHERKAGIVENLNLDMSMFTQSAEDTPIHVVKWNFLGETWPYFRPNYVDAAAYAAERGASRVIGFVPTGWVHNAKKNGNKVLSKNNVCIHLVPYSEHSSFEELIDFVRMIRPSRVVPTVNAHDEKQVAKQLKYFSNLVDINASKLSFISKIGKSSTSIVSRDAAPPQPHQAAQQEGVDKGQQQQQDKEEAEDQIVVLEERDQSVIVDLSQTCEDSKKLGSLMEICGTSDMEQLQSILEESSGDVERAASMYFDRMERNVTMSSRTAGKSPGKSSQKSILSYFGSPPSSKTKAPPEVAVVPIQDTATKVPAISNKTVSLQSSVATPKIRNVQIDSVATPLEKYTPKEDAMWMEPDATPYAHIARAFETMESTTKRTTISICLTNALRSILTISPNDLKSACYLLLGRLAPDYHGIELNVGSSTVATAMTEALGISRNKIHEMHKTEGDLGSIGFKCKKSQSMLRAPMPLTVQGIYDTLMAIATDSGQGSHGRKKAHMVRMLRSSTSPIETKFLIRTLVRNLRVGANWRSVMPALGKAILLHKMMPEFPPKEELENAATSSIDMYHIAPNIDTLISIMLDFEPSEWTSKVSLTPGVPIKPMLAKISEGVSDAFDQSMNSAVLVEYKYDGMRAQIHVKRQGFQDDDAKKIKIFSRNCEDRTASFDLQSDVLDALGDHVMEIIFDSEICAIAKNEDGTFYIRSFQDLSSRPRQASGPCATDVEICAFMFDCLQLNGESLLKKPLRERRELMMSSLPNRTQGKVEFAQGSVFEYDETDTDSQLSSDTLQQLLVNALDNKAEGVMIKMLESPYDPNKRSNKWIKLKKDYCSDLSDTIDMCVIGAWHGNGRKAGWYSPFLMAVYDESTSTFQSLCRVMSGFSDEFYKNATERLSKTVVESKPFDVMTGENPAVWFGTREVWEIRGAEVQISPVHACAMGQIHEGKGLGLRFPRFLRIRDDKDPHDITTSTDIVSMYLKQNK